MGQKAELYCPTCHGRMDHLPGRQDRICPFCGTKMLTDGNEIIEFSRKTLETQPEVPEKRPNTRFWGVVAVIAAVAVFAALAILLLR